MHKCLVGIISFYTDMLRETRFEESNGTLYLILLQDLVPIS